MRQAYNLSVVAEHFLQGHVMTHLDIRYAIVSRVYKFGAAEASPQNTNPLHSGVGLPNRR